MLKVATSIELNEIRSFTPCQHNLAIAEDLKSAPRVVDEVFDTQTSNIKYILSNTLDNKTIKDLADKAHMPEDTAKLMYNEVAQKSLELGIQELRKAKFSMDYNEVDVSNKNTNDNSPSP